MHSLYAQFYTVSDTTRLSTSGSQFPFAVPVYAFLLFSFHFTFSFGTL